MKHFYALLFILFAQICQAQCTFTSNSSAFGTNNNWDEGQNWTVDAGGCTQGVDYPGSTGNTDIVNMVTGEDIDFNLGSVIDISTLNLNGGNITFTASGGDLDVNSDFNVTASSTVTGDGIVTNARMDMANAVEISIDGGQILTVGSILFNSNGILNVSGTIAFDASSTTGTKVFDEVNILDGGTWDASAVTRAFSFDDNISIDANGTWNGCSNTTACRYQFRQTLELSGDGTMNVPDIRVYDDRTFTNNGNIIVTDNIDGQTGATAFGTFINNGTLDLRDNGSYTELTYTLNNSGSTVIYSGSGNENIDLGPFYDLEINKDVGVQCDVDGADVTVDNNMTISQGLVRVRTANTLLVTNDLDIAGGEMTILTDASATVDVNGNVTVNGGELDQNLGTFDAAGSMTVNTGIVSVGGATLFNVGGTYTASGGTNDFNSNTATLGGLTIDAGQTVSMGGIDITVGGTALVNGILEIDGGTGDKNFNDFTLSNNGNLNFSSNETVSVGNNLSMSGTSTITGGNDNRIVTVTGTTSIPSGTATVGAVQFNANGATTIDGTLSFSSTTGTKTFSDITLNASGTWDNGNVNEVFTVTGNLINNGGTWTPCTNTTACSLTLTSTSGTISGSGAFNFTDLIIDGTASYTNTGNVVMTDNITGTGAFINGNGGTLELRDNGNYSISTLTLNTTNSLVRFAGGTQETITIGPFYDLDINMDASVAALVNGTDVTVENDVTVSGGIFRQSSNTLAITGNVTVNGGAVDWNSGTVIFVDLTINNSATTNIQNSTITSTGTITVDDGILEIDGNGGTYIFNNITVNSSGTWDVESPYDPTINGNLYNDGTFEGCTDAGTGCDYTLTSTSGTISGSGAMTLMSDIILNDGASYTNTNSGGFNVTDGLETTSGSGTFINGANGVLSYSGTTGNMTISAFNASASPNTVIYNRTSSDQLIEPTTGNVYHNLTINKADEENVTTGEEFTINGTLTLTLGDLIMGGQNLIIGETGSISGGSSTSYIQQTGLGRVIKRYPTSSFSDPLSIPFGDGAFYAPMSFTLNSGSSVLASAQIEFEYVNASGHPLRGNNNSLAGGDDDGTGATDYINDYWELDLTSISNLEFDATIDYSGNGSRVGDNESNMLPVVLRNGTPQGGSATDDWHVVGLNGSKGNGSVNVVSDIVTFTGIRNVTNDLSTWTLYAMDNAAERLPITLISFEAEQFENHVELFWATADEVNNDFFTIERSNNGFDFQPILTVAGAGNSEINLEYQAIDPAPLNGTNYYRLKQTDFNGQFEYSSVLVVNFVPSGISMDSIQVYPNPSQRGEPIQLIGLEYLDSTSTNYRLMDNAGHTMRSGSISDLVEGKVTLLNSGLYLLQIKNPSGQKVIKILID